MRATGAVAWREVVPPLVAFTGAGGKGAGCPGKENPAPEITAVAFGFLGFPPNFPPPPR